MTEPWDEPLPIEFWQGVEQFNRGEFYACHDTLEAIWIPAVGPEKSLYQGIIQIAVAIYHLDNLNWRGAVILMGEGLNRLRHYPDTYVGLDLGQFRQEVADLLETLQNLGADGLRPTEGHRVAAFAWRINPDPQPDPSTIETAGQSTEAGPLIDQVICNRPMIQKAIVPLGN
jgi:uncharacterized protein